MPKTDITDFAPTRSVAERVTVLLEQMARECKDCGHRTPLCCRMCSHSTARALVEEMAVSGYRLGVIDVLTGKLECRDLSASSRAADKRYAEKQKAKRKVAK